MKVNRINPEITLLYDPRYIRSVKLNLNLIKIYYVPRSQYIHS